MDTEPSGGTRTYRRRRARARELTLHAALLACALWLAVAVDMISPGPLGRFSRFPKGNDFVQFYVAGSLARAGQFHALGDAGAFRSAQQPLLHGAQGSFPPVYGPQVALLFAPLASLPYLAALALWSLFSLALFAWTVVVCAERADALKPWPVPVAAIAAAYPPIALLVLDGQISAIGAAALALLVIALSRGSRRLAGAAVGILGYKFSLFVPALAVCVLAGEWTIACSALVVAALQLILAIPIVGLDVVLAFLRNALAFAGSPDLLAKNRFLMASLRTFWGALLPPTAALAAYVVSGAGCLWAAALGWRQAGDPLRRAGILSVAVVLAAPHLYFYDLVLLVPAFVASAAILATRRAPLLRWCTYLAFLAPLAAPIAAMTRIQPVTLVLTAWLGALIALFRREPEPGEDRRSV